MKIRGKMFLAGFGVFLALLVVGGVAGLVNFSIDSATSESETARLFAEKRNAQLEILNEYNLRLVALTLNAMDSIIDKDSGSISKERMGEIKDNGEWLLAHVKDIAELADTDSEKAEAETLSVNVNKFVNAVRDDLPALIASSAATMNKFKGADQGSADFARAEAGVKAKFDEMDDTLDVASSQVKGTIKALIKSVRDEARDANTTMAAKMLEVKKVISDGDTALLAFGAVVILISILVAILFSNSITRPIAHTVDALNSIAAMGDINLVLPEKLLARKDELGDLAKALKELVEFQKHEVGSISAIAGGDWTTSIAIRSDKDTLGQSLNGMIEQINNVLGQIKDASLQVNFGANEVSSASQALSQGATEQAASLEEISSSLTEIGSQTKTNAENANQAAQLS
ncbi:MAG: HAMP domain-containing protein, partial [Planctomycetes bacterium]|nr:HAMP domain-containing protein [Planctomycetota bacterium]